MQVSQALNRTLLLNGSRTAVLDGDLLHTWDQFGIRIRKLAGALKNLGVADDDKVAVLMLNGHRYLELYYGVPWAGAVVVPLNIRLAPPELVTQINEAEVKVLVVDETFAMMLPSLSEHLTTVQHVVLASDGASPDGTLSYETLLDAAAEVDDAGRADDDVLGIFYTGGTTGRAKGVMLTHDNIIANCQNAMLCNPGTGEDVYLHSAPMFHLADCSSNFAVTCTAATHAFIPFFEPKSMMQAIERYRVTLALAIPTMLNMILNHPDFPKHDFSSLRTVTYGASPIPLPLLQQALAELPCEFLQGYGMTELSPLITYLPAKDHVRDPDETQLRRLKSAGIPVFTAQVRIVDEHDNEVPRGEVGEICGRGPMVMKGYWKQPEATETALRGGWMHTGDAGYMDNDGYVYLVDRTKDMIVTGGENVFSVEVESALYEHPAVLEAAVIGVPDEKWGEAVHAVIVLKPGKSADEDEIISHCHGRIANYKCPKSVSFENQELPKSGAGKILKRDLRTPFWEGHDRQIH